MSTHKKTVPQGKLLSALALVLVLSMGCRSEKQDASSSKAGSIAPSETSPTLVLKQQSIPWNRAYLGTVEAARRARLTSRIHAHVTHLHVSMGSKVRQGTLLMELDQREPKARLQGARAAFEQIQSDWKRNQSLHAQQAITDSEMERVRAAFVSAEAALKEAEAAWSHTRIEAPFDGTVQSIHVETGDGVQLGQVLLELDAPNYWEIRTHLPPRMAQNLKPGSKLMVRDRLEQTEMPVVVSELASAASPLTRRVAVLLSGQHDAPWIPGEMVRVQVPIDAAPAIWIPSSAIITQGQLAMVKVLQDGRHVRRVIKTGRRQGTQTEVLSGLQENQRLILNPSPKDRISNPDIPEMEDPTPGTAERMRTP